MKIGIIGAMDVEIERFNDLFNLTELLLEHQILAIIY